MVKGHVLCVIITQSIRKSICDSPFMHKWVKGNFEMLLKFLSIFFNLHWGSVLKASLHWNFLQSLTFLSLFFSYYYHLFFFLFYLFIYLLIYLFICLFWNSSRIINWSFRASKYWRKRGNVRVWSNTFFNKLFIRRRIWKNTPLRAGSINLFRYFVKVVMSTVKFLVKNLSWNIAGIFSN